jgi:beta-glucosidase
MRSAFRPSVLRLEERIVPSHGHGHGRAAHGGGAVDAAGIQAGSVPVAYTPVNNFYATPEWMGLHNSYVSQANQGGQSVLFLGDSITNFWNDPARGLAAWQGQLAPLGATQFGIPGDQTADLLWRVENGELNGKPQVAVVMIGINDLMHGRSAADTANGVINVVEAIRAESPQTKILVLGLLPEIAFNAAEVDSEVAQVNATLAGLDNGRDVRFLDLGGLFLQPDGTPSPALLGDGIHPNPEGYQVLADALVGPIAALLDPSAPVAPSAAAPKPQPSPAPAPTPHPSAPAATTPTTDPSSPPASVPIWFVNPDPTTDAPDPTPPHRPWQTKGPQVSPLEL